MLPFELQVRVRELEAQRRDLLKVVEANNKTIASLMAERDALRIRVEEFEADLREGTIASADRKVGFRVVEPKGREITQAQGASLVGANLQRSRLSGIAAQSADFAQPSLRPIT